MKALLFGLLCMTVLLGGCSAIHDDASMQSNSYCKGAGYSGGFIIDHWCVEHVGGACHKYKYKYSCYNSIITLIL